MSGGDWLQHAAVRGWLIAVLVLLPCTSTAQQETEEPPAALEQGQGTAVETPAPQSETPKPSAQQEPPAAQPLSAAPVQSKRPAEPACDARCQAAEQRENSDLKAQQSMADAAVELIIVSWWQFGAGVIGLTALFFTLKYTRDTAKAAIDANQAARDTSKLELRPYLGVSVARALQLTTNNQNVATLTIENVGKTPAINVSTWFASVGVKAGETFDWGLAEKPANLKRFTAPPNGKFILNIKTKGPLVEDEIREIREGRITLYVFGAIEYTDVFGDPHTTTYRYEFAREHEVGDILNVCKEGNDAT